MNFQMFKLDLEKAEEPEIKLPTFPGSSKKQDSSRKTSTSALLTMPKPLTLWIKQTGKFLKKWETRPPDLHLRNLYAVKKQQLELDMGHTGSNLGKEYFKVVYCHPDYLTYVQRLSCEMPAE